MAAEKPRNRIVVFRLTQEEFATLKSACSERGGRNLSDFTRSELLSFIHSQSLAGLIERRFSAIEQSLAELHQSVDALRQRLDGNEAIRSATSAMPPGSAASGLLVPDAAPCSLPPSASR